MADLRLPTFPTGARWLAPVFALILPVIATAACWGPTQIIVSIDTDLTCATVNSKQFAIVVAPSEDALLTTPSAATSGNCGPGAAAGDSSLGTLTLVPSGARDARVFVKVVIGIDRATDQCVNGTDTSGCIVARRSTSFVVHDSLSLPMRLDSACLGIDCGAGASCDQGLCVSDDCHLDPAGCSGPGTPDDSGTPPDAKATDNECPDKNTADCDKSADNGCETNIATSSSNCGACGRDCGAAGPCTNGMCADTLLLGNLDSPHSIDTSPGNVFIGLDTDAPNTSTVIQCPADQCPRPNTISPPHTHVHAVVVSGNELFWGTDDGVWSCTGTACTDPMTTPVPPAHVCNDPLGARSLVIASNNKIIYAVSSGTLIEQCIKSQPPTEFGQSANKVLNVVGNANSIIFSQTGSADGSQPFGFASCPLATGCGVMVRKPVQFPTVAAPGINDLGSVVLDDSGLLLYWSEAPPTSAGTVNGTSSPLNGKTTTLYSGKPRGLIVDKEHIYWAEDNDVQQGSIHRMKRDGSQQITLAINQHHPSQLALMALPTPRLYWTNTGTGAPTPSGEVHYTVP